MQPEWYKDWFNSPYYHLLYSHRDENEAEFFLTRLIQELKIESNARVLDLACGKGRHAIFLSKSGLNVTGVDLSPNNITEASAFSNDKLRFFVGDMRNELKGEKFNYIFNLFTSFGYFDQDADNLKVLESVYQMLEPDGLFILDFFNASKLSNELCADESKKVGQIIFNIHRHSCAKYIEKEIHFEDNGRAFTFTEKVRALDYSTLKNMLDATGLQIITTFGSYSLSQFEENTSDRLIIVAKKK